MNRLANFSTINPTGERTGIEPVRLDVLKAVVNNVADVKTAPAASSDHPQPALIAQPASAPAVPLISKNIRLPADLVDFIDYIYTKEKRMKKQDAYTYALEQFFRPLMKS